MNIAIMGIAKCEGQPEAYSQASVKRPYLSVYSKRLPVAYGELYKNCRYYRRKSIGEKREAHSQVSAVSRPISGGR